MIQSASLLSRLRKHIIGSENFSDKRVIVVIVLFWLIAKCMTPKLWLAGRLFPLVPIHTQLAVIPGVVHSFLYYSSVGLLLLLLFRPVKSLATLLLICELSACLLDQNRWQPWEYQYLFILVCYITAKNNKIFLLACQIIFIGTYFFSGINKMNSDFILSLWNRMILNQWAGIETYNVYALKLGYLIPISEVIGALILFSKSRKHYAVYFFISMHLFILLLLGPLGLNYNSIIWPWNVAMTMLLPILFINQKVLLQFLLQKEGILKIVVLCWFLLPWLSLWGYWDYYLSSNLYSGVLPRMKIYMKDINGRHCLSKFAKRDIASNKYIIDVQNWSFKELGAPVYPQPRVYKEIARQWKQKNRGLDKDLFYLYYSGKSQPF